jgi:hypothetical protein
MASPPMRFGGADRGMYLAYRLQSIGPLVEYHGMRQPCYADADMLLGRVQREHFDLWEFLVEPGGSVMNAKAVVVDF